MSHDFGEVSETPRAKGQIDLVAVLPLALVRSRLSTDIEEGRLLEAPGVRTQRHLSGRLEGNDLSLRVVDANVLTRRKSWNVEFRGRLAEHSRGTRIVGEVSIPDRASLRLVMWLIRIACFAPIGFLLITWSGKIDLTGAAIAAVVAVAGSIGTIRLERDGSEGAAADGDLIATYLRAVASAT